MSGGGMCIFLRSLMLPTLYATAAPFNPLPPPGCIPNLLTAMIRWRCCTIVPSRKQGCQTFSNGGQAGPLGLDQPIGATSPPPCGPRRRSTAAHPALPQLPLHGQRHALGGFAQGCVVEMDVAVRRVDCRASPTLRVKAARAFCPLSPAPRAAGHKAGPSVPSWRAGPHGRRSGRPAAFHAEPDGRSEAGGAVRPGGSAAVAGRHVGTARSRSDDSPHSGPAGNRRLRRDIGDGRPCRGSCRSLRRHGPACRGR